MTITLDPDILAKLEEKAKSESRDVDAVANELLRQALGEEKPYKLQWGTWDAEMLIDPADRKKLHEALDDDPDYMRKRGLVD